MSASRLSSTSRRTRAATVVAVAAIALIAAAGILRFWQLGLQSYWVDEKWSVGAASLGLLDTLHTIKYEIHPPLYQLLLWVWVHVGGTSPVWTRLLSAILGAVGVFLSFWLLRRTSLDPLLRLLLVAATAASGMAIVYAQETRSYGALWCASVAVTAMTLRMGERPRTLPDRRIIVGWAVAGALASALHLFGSLLVVASALVIAWRWRGRIGRLAAWTALALAPQVLWLSVGLFIPGFASASGWISAPTLVDLWSALTTLFAFDGLRMTAGGFVWSSPWALIVVAVVAAAGVLLAWRAARQGEAVPKGRVDGAWFPVSVLWMLAAIILATAWLGSQVVPVWTVRNLIVAAPALTWCAVSLIYVLGRRAGAAVLASAVVVALLAVNLAWVAVNLARTYKTDFTGAVDYLDRVRAQEADALFVGNVTIGWLLATDHADDDAYLDWLLSRSTHSVAPNADDVRVLPGVTVFVYDARPGDDAAVTAAEITRWAGETPACEAVPFVGVAVVRCEGP